MKEITAQDIMHLNFLKKEHFTGSNEGMRFRMEKHEHEKSPEEGAGDGEETKPEMVTELLVSVWPEPFSYEKTEPSLIIQAHFPFTEEGVEAGRQWMNAQGAAFDWQGKRQPWH